MLFRSKKNRKWPQGPSNGRQPSWLGWLVWLKAPSAREGGGVVEFMFCLGWDVGMFERLAACEEAVSVIYWTGGLCSPLRDSWNVISRYFSGDALHAGTHNNSAQHGVFLVL